MSEAQFATWHEEMCTFHVDAWDIGNVDAWAMALRRVDGLIAENSRYDSERFDGAEAEFKQWGSRYESDLAQS